MRTTLACALIVGLVSVSPAFAETRQPSSKSNHSGTIVKWALFGAAAGFGTGFILGFRAYDDATFAEQKIMRSGIIGAAIGGVAGGMMGRQLVRLREAQASARPSDRDRLGMSPRIRLQQSKAPPHRAFKALFAPPATSP